jgi:hypothetical protein
MNEGVKILIERMKTNPEEFVGEGVYSKWSNLFSMYQDALAPEDVETFKNARNKLIQEHFTQRVMKELLAPEEDDSLGKPWYSKQGDITLSAGQTLGHASLTLTTEPLVQAHIDAHNAVLKKQKKHQTLFGKLFNYT